MARKNKKKPKKKNKTTAKTARKRQVTAPGWRSLDNSARKAYRFRHVVRFTIEFDTPLHVGSGKEGEGGMTDAGIVTDANGLAAVPGDSLGGALREAFTRCAPREVDNIFGFQERQDGLGSRLTISWGAVHNCQDIPVTGIIDRRQLLLDEVLRSALMPEVREHVRISSRGAADRKQRGLFSEDCLAAGHRFSFELELVSRKDEELNILHTLTALVDSPAFRLGGRTRRGFGACRVIRRKAAAFDLSQKTDYEVYCNHSANLAEQASDLQEFILPDHGPTGLLEIPLRVSPRSYWLFGGGEDIEEAPGDADIAQFRVSKISWENNTGRLERNILVVPGSGVKGPLAHRTAFHYNRLTGVYADNVARGCENSETGFTAASLRLNRHCGECNPAVQELFGFAKDNTAAVTGRRGRVLIDDLFFAAGEEPRPQLIHHAPLGRFSGAPVNLFSERPFWQGDWPTLTIRVIQPETIDPLCRQAFVLALKDLAEGKLQVGAGAGRGLGFCRIDNFPEDILNQWPDQGENHV